MSDKRKDAILITGVGKRVGFVLAKHFLAVGYEVIGTYRSDRSQIKILMSAGADLYQCDFNQQNQVDAFIQKIIQRYQSLRMVIHNASAWLPDDCEHSAVSVLNQMMTVHVNVPYQMNLAFEALLTTSSESVGQRDIIHISDFVATKGSTKHIAYAASKAAMDNLTYSFAAKLAPTTKVNSIAPALIMYNDEDTDSYKLKAASKSLMGIVAGVDELINTVNYVMNSHYVTGRVLHLDGGRHLK
ncbi:dihydromonapterin reductase [Parashewanella spongiae]|uniref:Dihydromonapterin reductase n=1 Tax=Parashewanella spongiae TaxID=342950 RepID=A0A3A6TXH8_9GAMM|nr:dihydromonapterin reductase [Parashewanella spongiae]MCL1080000.1 dihydromonapterin reductase [Parashewanella spongiae]RJY06180.1 dihydromonapterin reductase [Parashewanella spongiae]